MRTEGSARVPTWIFALLFAATFLPAASALGRELWHAPADAAACSLVLVNEAGGVVIDPTGDRILVSSDVPGLAINATRGERDVTLTVSSSDPASSGDINLRVPVLCKVAVRTDRGPVDIELGPKPLPLAVETVTGTITARVDPGVPVTIAVATSGEITTDFSIDIDFKYHQEPAKFGTVSVKNGGETVRLTSRRGAVRVLWRMSTRPRIDASDPSQRRDP